MGMINLRRSVRTILNYFLQILISFLTASSVFMQQSINPGITVVTHSNLGILDHGEWCLTFNAKKALQCQEVTDKKVALLNVNNLKSAQIAAELSVEKYDDMLYCDNGNFSDMKGCKIERSAKPFQKVLDYYIFFQVKNI